MAEEDGETLWVRSGECARQVSSCREWWQSVVFNACYDYGVAVASECDVFVEEEVPSVAAYAPLEFGHVGCSVC